MAGFLLVGSYSRCTSCPIAQCSVCIKLKYQNKSPGYLCLLLRCFGHMMKYFACLLCIVHATNTMHVGLGNEEAYQLPYLPKSSPTDTVIDYFYFFLFNANLQHFFFFFFFLFSMLLSCSNICLFDFLVIQCSTGLCMHVE